MQTQTFVQNPKQPFQSIREAARTTGISEYQIRRMLRENALPGFYSGVKFNVDVEMLLRQLREPRDEQ